MVVYSNQGDRMTTQDLTVKIKIKPSWPRTRIFETARRYLVTAYGLKDHDRIEMRHNTSQKFITATITVDGPRRGAKWVIS